MKTRILSVLLTASLSLMLCGYSYSESHGVENSKTMVKAENTTGSGSNTVSTANTSGTAKQSVSSNSGKADENLRGVWLSYIDQQVFLKSKCGDRDEYDNVFSIICKKAKKQGINNIFVHVRSHNDAIYPSSIYPWSTEMLKGDPGFDPLLDMTQIAHREGLKIHAWINPYGYRKGVICGSPALATNDNVVAGVEEIINRYDVDGIHFDDYFPPFGEDIINSMVLRVHEACKQRGKVFGIAPQGNINNCLAAGANVQKWLSSKDYVDYIAPQIYWTDHYGSDGSEAMSTERLKAWKALNTTGIPMYIGMALYRAGSENASDPGWAMSTDNLAKQYKAGKEMGYKGYILFSTKYLVKPDNAQSQEIKNLNESVAEKK